MDCCVLRCIVAAYALPTAVGGRSHLPVYSLETSGKERRADSASTSIASPAWKTFGVQRKEVMIEDYVFKYQHPCNNRRPKTNSCCFNFLIYKAYPKKKRLLVRRTKTYSGAGTALAIDTLAGGAVKPQYLREHALSNVPERPHDTG